MAMAVQQFSLSDCKVALSDILEAFRQPVNTARMEEAKESAGNDMLKAMQVVLPVASQIEMDVIQKYGFSADGDGLIRFSQAVKLYETQDREIKELNQELRSILMPPVHCQLPPTQPHHGAENGNS